MRWIVNLKTPSTGIWVIKIRIYHESFIVVTRNSYSCAHGTNLSWDRLTFIMVRHPLHIKMPLGSSAAMMFLFLVVPNIWQWMSFKLSFEITLKNYSNLYLHPLLNLICRGNMRYLTCDMHLKNQRFVDIDLSMFIFSRLLSSSARDQISLHIYGISYLG